MIQNQNMTIKFRAALRNELTGWVEGGIISGETADTLSLHYQLNNIREESSRLLSAVIFTIGGLLLGGGLISFVAANWEDISTPVKLAILFSSLLGFHTAGYWLWQMKDWRRLGHALIFCGCLVFGASIGLVAQIFHISGDWYGAFGAWAVGSLVMAWAVRSWIIGLLALCTSFLWFMGFQDDNHERAALLYPLALFFSLIPLACRVGSRVLYAGTLLGVVSAASVLAGSGDSGKHVLFVMASGGLFIWALSGLHRSVKVYKEFEEITAGLGLSLLAATAYVWSFHDMWRPSLIEQALSPLAILFIVLSIIASYVTLRAERQPRLWLEVGVLAACAILCGSALLAGLSTGDGEILFTMAANLAALILAAVIIGFSLIEERRAAFWLGTLYLVLIVLSRFLEYDTSLLLKSLAFLACGVAVIFAGMGYETYLRIKGSSADPDNLKETVYE